MVSNGCAERMSGLSDASGKPLFCFVLCFPVGQHIVDMPVCWFSPHRLLRFAMRFELSRGTVGETVEFEHTEIGAPDEKAAVYR